MEKLLEYIEEEVKRIYEVGYHHGWNISRPVPKKENEGWGQHFENIKNKLNEYINEKEQV